MIAQDMEYVSTDLVIVKVSFLVMIVHTLHVLIPVQDMVNAIMEHVTAMKIIMGQIALYLYVIATKMEYVFIIKNVYAIQDLWENIVKM